MQISLDTAYDVALKAAHNASRHIMTRFSETSLSVLSDAGHDVKLQVDVETEQIIKDTIRSSFTDHGFICEESGFEGSNSEYTWIVDPLDGTVNFSRGIPHFCTYIALKRRKQYILGVVRDPVRNETFSALLDKRLNEIIRCVVAARRPALLAFDKSELPSSTRRH